MDDDPDGQLKGELHGCRGGKAAAPMTDAPMWQLLASIYLYIYIYIYVYVYMCVCKYKIYTYVYICIEHTWVYGFRVYAGA